MDEHRDETHPASKRRRKANANADKKFECNHDGCGKSYSRAEHLYRHQLNRESRAEDSPASFMVLNLVQINQKSGITASIRVAAAISCGKIFVSVIRSDTIVKARSCRSAMRLLKFLLRWEGELSPPRQFSITAFRQASLSAWSAGARQSKRSISPPWEENTR